MPNDPQPGSAKSKLIDALSRGGSDPVTLSLSLAAGAEPAADIAQRLVQQKTTAKSVDVVQVHPLARVFAVRGAPKALLPLVQASEVTDAIYSAQPDILPKPVKRRAVDITSGEGFYPVKKTGAAQRKTTARRGKSRKK
jgi:hypothetical protein